MMRRWISLAALSLLLFSLHSGAQPVSDSSPKQEEAVRKTRRLMTETHISIEPTETTLAKLLETLEKQVGEKKISLRIDAEAFGKDAAKISDTPVRLPKMKNVSLSTAVRLAMKQVTARPIDYRLGDAEFVITTPARAALHRRPRRARSRREPRDIPERFPDAPRHQPRPSARQPRQRSKGRGTGAADLHDGCSGELVSHHRAARIDPGPERQPACHPRQRRPARGDRRAVRRLAPPQRRQRLDRCPPHCRRSRYLPQGEKRQTPDEGRDGRRKAEPRNRGAGQASAEAEIGGQKPGDPDRQRSGRHVSFAVQRDLLPADREARGFAARPMRRGPSRRRPPKACRSRATWWSVRIDDSCT